MMPQQLWDTTLDPLKRMLKKLTVDEAAEANSMFSLLMGDKVSDKRFFPMCLRRAWLLLHKAELLLHDGKFFFSFRSPPFW